ncbi:MAG: hypothetical protein JW751_12615 [Polyangiaceae bacterium]|nr:hypothetical protein [Polyangiaceae bacterium]
MSGSASSPRTLPCGRASVESRKLRSNATEHRSGNEAPAPDPALSTPTESTTAELPRGVLWLAIAAACFGLLLGLIASLTGGAR